MRSRAALVALCAALPLLAACSGGTPSAASSPTAGATSTPTAQAALPNFNSRLGSNRPAAEVAAAIGRKLYAGGYWEVYVRTQPASLPTPGPGDSSDSAAAALVTATDIVLASESPGTIKSFGAGGEAHERQVLTDLDAIVRKAFPNLAGDTMRVFYGESFQHGLATFDHGRLVSYPVKKIG